jgi:hypothetical protein
LPDGELPRRTKSDCVRKKLKGTGKNLLNIDKKKKKLPKKKGS